MEGFSVGGFIPFHGYFEVYILIRSNIYTAHSLRVRILLPGLLPCRPHKELREHERRISPSSLTHRAGLGLAPAHPRQRLGQLYHLLHPLHAFSGHFPVVSPSQLIFLIKEI